MSGHTPGPWIVNGFGNDFRTLARTKNGVAISALAEAGDDVANARLIAAAPELLAALKDFVHSVEHKDPSWIAGSMVLARAAIAKTEGKS